MARFLHDFIQSIMQIQEAANSIEIRGRQNSAYIVFINKKCDEMIGNFNDIIRNADKPTPEPVISEETDGDEDEQNSGLPE